MKILHIAPTPFFADRGCHMRILGEMKALIKRGHEITLCTYHNGRDIEGIKTLRNIRIPWYNKLEAGPSWHKIYIDLLLLLKSILVFLKEKPDLIHGHLHEGALIAGIIKFLFFWKKTPVVFDVQGSMTFELDSYAYYTGLKKLIRPIFFIAEKTINILPDFFVCSSVSNRDLMVNKFNIPQHKCEAIIDGVHTGFFQNVKDANKIKKNFNLDNSSKIVIFTGALLKSKGIDVLFNAIPHIIKKVPDAIFFIVGYPTKEWKDYAIKENLQKHVRFSGKVDYFDLPSYLNITRIAVDPKIDAAGESSGKIINYMGAGQCVVCFDSKNNRKFLNEGGIYAENGNIKDLAENIIYALNNPKAVKEKGIINKKRVEELFSWNAGGEKIENIYKKLLKK
ncbi:MAG: glycosyltransferase family 4 protein [Candidatus Aureabacteria bacterium]|nr:glycosyltransferase family 4 protein [Candidatus Auribacterota bacterium]